MFEPIQCPMCSRGKLVPLLAGDSTNWVCSQPDCSYIIHQHGTSNSKVWKGEAGRDEGKARGSWYETS